MTEFPDVHHLQTDEFKNWERKLGRMSDEELRRCQERLANAIDAQSANDSASTQSIRMLEACNNEIQRRVTASNQVERKMLLNAEGNIPFEVSDSDISVPKQLGEAVVCQTCKMRFAIYCDEDVSDDELATAKEFAEAEALKQLADQHAVLAMHRQSMRIRVKYPASKKQG